MDWKLLTTFTVNMITKSQTRSLRKPNWPRNCKRIARWNKNKVFSGFWNGSVIFITETFLQASTCFFRRTRETNNSSHQCNSAKPRDDFTWTGTILISQLEAETWYSHGRAKNSFRWSCVTRLTAHPKSYYSFQPLFFAWRAQTTATKSCLSFFLFSFAYE